METILAYNCHFPKEAANCKNEEGKLCLGVGMGMKVTLIPVEEDVTVEPQVIEMLRSINFPHMGTIVPIVPKQEPLKIIVRVAEKSKKPVNQSPKVENAPKTQEPKKG